MYIEQSGAENALFPTLKLEKTDGRTAKKRVSEFNDLMNKTTKLCRAGLEKHGHRTLRCDVKFFDGIYISVYGEYTVRSEGRVSYRFPLSVTYDLSSGGICVSSELGIDKNAYFELKKYFLRYGTEFTKKEFAYSFYLCNEGITFYTQRENTVISKRISICDTFKTSAR